MYFQNITFFAILLLIVSANCSLFTENVKDDLARFQGDVEHVYHTRCFDNTGYTYYDSQGHLPELGEFMQDHTIFCGYDLPKYSPDEIVIIKKSGESITNEELHFQQSLKNVLVDFNVQLPGYTVESKYVCTFKTCSYWPAMRTDQIDFTSLEHVQNTLFYPTSIVFILDISGSMTEHNKLLEAISHLEEFLKFVNEKDHIGLIIRDSYYAPSPATESWKSILMDAANSVTPFGSLDLVGSLNATIELFNDTGYINTVVLLTDNKFNFDTSSVINVYDDYDVTINAIIVGGNEDTSGNVELLACLTGGVYELGGFQNILELFEAQSGVTDGIYTYGDQDVAGRDGNDQNMIVTLPFYDRNYQKPLYIGTVGVMLKKDSGDFDVIKSKRVLESITTFVSDNWITIGTQEYRVKDSKQMTNCEIESIRNNKCLIFNCTHEITDRECERDAPFHVEQLTSNIQHFEEEFYIRRCYITGLGPYSCPVCNHSGGYNRGPILHNYHCTTFRTCSHWQYDNTEIYFRGCGVSSAIWFRGLQWCSSLRASLRA